MACDIVFSGREVVDQKVRYAFFRFIVVVEYQRDTLLF